MVEAFPEADISIAIVWIDMVQGDREESLGGATRLLGDPRVRYFYDPAKRAGRAVARSLGWKDEVAWDIYLFYAEGGVWTDGPPVPTDWMHQLSRCADIAHLRVGQDLVEKLREATKALIDR